MTTKKADVPTAQTEEKNSIANLQNEVDKQIQKFNVLKEKLGHRNHFILTKEKIHVVWDSVKESELNEQFENEQISLMLVRKNDAYSKEETLLKVSQNALILEFIDFLNGKIDLRIQVLESEILAVN